MNSQSGSFIAMDAISRFVVAMVVRYKLLLPVPLLVYTGLLSATVLNSDPMPTLTPSWTTINSNIYAERESGELCDTEVFHAECHDGSVILMTRAVYGRMRLGRCVEMELGFLGCRRDVLLMADGRCSGKRVCDIRVPDAQFEATRPCLKELKNYMEASYRCLPVETVSTDYCRRHNELNVTATTASRRHGYIANIVTSDTPACDGTSHPWVIEVAPGQLINLTLYDFAVEGVWSGAGVHAVRKHVTGRQQQQQQQQQQQRQPISRQPQKQQLQQQRQQRVHDLTDAPLRTWVTPPPPPTTLPPPTLRGGGPATATPICRQYGLLQDGPESLPVPVCGGIQRISHLFTSRSNLVKIWVTAGSAPNDLKRFVIEYSVIGCPDFTAPAHSFIDRQSWSENNMVVSVRCAYSNQRWRLVCGDDNTWSGHVGNCSIPHAPSMNEVLAENTENTYPLQISSHDHVAVVIIIVATTGLAILVAILVIVHCSRRLNV